MKRMVDKVYFPLCLCALALALVYLTHLTWLKWTDILVDSGRELYIPEVLAAGKVLYRDIYYVYGPFSPYFNALLYKLFGVNAYVLAAGGFVSLLAICALVGILARVYLNRAAALFVTLCFLFIFPFGHHTGVPIFNYLIPYSYPAVHALLFSLAALVFLYRYLETGRTREGQLAGLCLFFAALTKMEIAAWLALTLGTGYWLHERGTGGRNASPKAIGRVILPLAGAAAIYVAFYAQGAAANLQNNLFDTALSNILMPKKSYAWLNFTGGLTVSAGLWLLFFGTIQYLWLAGCLVLGGRAYERWNHASSLGLKVLAVMAMGAFTLAGLAILQFRPLSIFGNYFMPVPLLCLVTLGLCLGNVWGGKRSARQTLLVCLCIFSVLLLLRMLLNVGVESMGFYLLVPGFLVYQILWLRVVPDLAGRRSTTWLICGVFVGLNIFYVAKSLDDSRAHYSQIDSAIPNARGTLKFCDAGRVSAYRELVDDLSRAEHAGKTLVVFPEGLWINYVTGLANPLYFYQYLPIDLSTQERLTLLTDELEQAKPDFFLISDRGVREYGAESIADYADPVREYVEQHYRFAKSYGSRIHLLVRR